MEIVDPDTLEPVPPGDSGEIVFTSITKDAFPVIGYRTKDITSLNPVPWTCGRPHIRMNKPTGRTDDMLIIRGVNVFPSQIESVLMENRDVAPLYKIAFLSIYEPIIFSNRPRMINLISGRIQ